jgi:Na+/melibiose symporter-like transporter
VSLWSHRDFLRLWSAQAVSAFGSRITRTGLPIIAIASLGVPESQIGVLAALQFAPGVVIALVAGGVVERGRKRGIMIASDLVRAALVASIAIAWWAGALTMAHVIVVGAGVGALSALFVIADRAYLPALIGKRHLADGNAKLETTEAIAEIGGPASAGVLFDAIGAPLAMLADAASYVWSAVLLGMIRAPEPAAPPPAPGTTTSARADLVTGLRAIFGHRELRAVVIAHVVWSISGGFFMTLYAPYCLRVLGLDASTLGIMVACGGVGALFGAVLANPIARRLGLGPTLIAAAALSVACALLIPIARGPAAVVIALLVAHQLLSDGFAVIFMVHAVTLRQTVLPETVLGRANAAVHVVTTGVFPLAALAAGGLADALGTRTAVWIGVLTGLAAPLCLLPLRTLRELPGDGHLHAE